MAQDWIENKLVSDVAEGLWGEKLPQNLVAIWGFPANSGREDYDRFYLSLNFNEYIEFPHSGLVHIEDAGGPDNPFSGAMIWLRRDTPVEHVTVERLDLQRGFLQGGIAGSYMGNAQNVAAGNANALAGVAAGGSTLYCTGAGTMACMGGSTLYCTGAGTFACMGGSTMYCTGAGTFGCTAGESE
jgi:hypothetical protein